MDTELASRTAMEIMDKQEEYTYKTQAKAISDAKLNISNLRKTVLRITKNHITSFIATCSLSTKYERDSSKVSIDDYKEEVKNTFEILSVL